LVIGGDSSGHSALSGWEIDTPMTVDGECTAPGAPRVFDRLDDVTGASTSSAGVSIPISRGGLSSRKPLKAACRTLPSAVQPANSISAISLGSVQWMVNAPCCRGVPTSNGLILRATLRRRGNNRLAVA